MQLMDEGLVVFLWCSNSETSEWPGCCFPCRPLLEAHHTVTMNNTWALHTTSVGNLYSGVNCAAPNSSSVAMSYDIFASSIQHARIPARIAEHSTSGNRASSNTSRDATWTHITSHCSCHHQQNSWSCDRNSAKFVSHSQTWKPPYTSFLVVFSLKAHQVELNRRK